MAAPISARRRLSCIPKDVVEAWFERLLKREFLFSEAHPIQGKVSMIAGRKGSVYIFRDNEAIIQSRIGLSGELLTGYISIKEMCLRISFYGVSHIDIEWIFPGVISADDIDDGEYEHIVCAHEQVSLVHAKLPIDEYIDFNEADYIPFLGMKEEMILGSIKNVLGDTHRIHLPDGVLEVSSHVYESVTRRLVNSLIILLRMTEYIVHRTI